MTLSATCAISEVSRNPSYYRAEQYDSDLGLYYLRARYYNPLTGRFMSRDPEAGVVTEPKTLHKYLYVAGDPVNRIDPSGRNDILEFAGETSEKLDFYNKFAGPNDLGACLARLFGSIGISVDNVTTDSSPSLLGRAATCEIELLWGGINPIPNHWPWTPWSSPE